MNQTSVNPTPDSPPPRRRAAALGVTAGLLAGGTVGLLVASPSLSTAAPIVAVGDADTETTTGAERPSTWMREALQELVDAGTITADQADAVVERLQAERPNGQRDGGFGNHRRGRRGAAFDGEIVSELLGLTTEEFRTELRAGRSIADIAAAQTVDVQVVIDALIDEAQAHLDLAVESGRLTAEEAVEKASEIATRVERAMNRTIPQRPLTPPSDSDDSPETPADG